MQQPTLFDLDDLAPEAPAPPAAHEAVLFGRDPTERIVAAEPLEGHLCLWRRLADGRVETTREPFSPWLLLTETLPLADARVVELEGDAAFRWLCEFPDRRAFLDARFLLRTQHVEHLTYGSATRLALTRTGKTLFKGLTLGDVVRMQVDLETDGLSPSEPGSRILIAACGATGHPVELLRGDERDILNDLVALVREWDPDILEGHNIFRFDLPYLMARARAHGIRLALGRDGSEPRAGTERNFAIGGITRPFVPVYLFGRHVIDTYLAVQRFDWARASLSSYGLKEAARSFGIAENDRVELPGAAIASVYREDPERVLTYAAQDIRETARLAELVTATEFYQTQMVPDAYGSCAVSGSGEKINSLFVREYLARGAAIPRPLPTVSYAGGYTDVRMTGVIDRVVKADVESLYPSLMLTQRIAPVTDSLGIFLPALRELTRRRLEAKARAQGAEGAERHLWDGLQGSFKVLVNSFYGYLGAAGFNFNDPAAAGRVTELGRELVQRIAADMEASGSRVIEIDTDGVYFVPPPEVAGEGAERAYVEAVGARCLAEGIRLAFDGRFRAMVSLKTKNYVLEGYDGEKTFRGASLRSRADEPYGRDFLASAVDLLLAHRVEEIGALYAATIEDLVRHRVSIERLSRRERVTDKTFTSAAKQRVAEVARDTPVGEYLRVYERANGRLGRSGDYTSNDESVTYYVEKLYKFALRLREAFGDRFDSLIPRPTPEGLPAQERLDLF
ncbi:MAG: DNA polymerase [Chthonomonadales bacterium]|nr:DNA polymerase [Chthonomonadales bacterium]